MNDIKSVLDEIEKQTRMVYAVRNAGYGKEIDIALAALDRNEITEEQYWVYIKGLAANAH